MNTTYYIYQGTIYTIHASLGMLLPFQVAYTVAIRRLIPWRGQVVKLGIPPKFKKNLGKFTWNLKMVVGIRSFPIGARKLFRDKLAVKLREGTPLEIHMEPWVYWYISLGGINTRHLEVSAILDNLHIPSSDWVRRPPRMPVTTQDDITFLE